MDTIWTRSKVGDRGATIFLWALAIVAVAVPIFSLLVPVSSPLHLSAFGITLIGKYLCYGMLALAVDLIWGYCGILSLGHAAFFTLGGYAMGMYLMRQIGTRGVYGDPVLPDFMVFLNWKSLPWFWYGFNHFSFALLMMALVPAALARPLRLVCLPFARHRRLFLNHHPGPDIRPHARLLPQ